MNHHCQTAVALVEGLGGRTLDEHTDDEWLIRVMTDPEGIEFCLVGRSPTSRSPEWVISALAPLSASSPEVVRPSAAGRTCQEISPLDSVSAGEVLGE